MPKLLEVRDLRTHFFTERGVVKAVDGISFEIEDGETVALVGESGCGKSVTARSIIRLVASPGSVVGGEILFEGADLLRLRDDEMRRVRGSRIAMVFQEPMTALNPVLTIGRQLTEAMELHLGLRGAAARRRAAELLGLVKVSDPERRLSQHPHELSGGMRQRVVLAMALSCNPRLILADEPTTALDVTIQAQILEVMQEATSELGTAILLITHDLGIVARYARKVNVMYAGKIVEQATTTDLYAEARHPYTIDLLSSVPRIDADRRVRLQAIHGQPPDLVDLPQGCSYRPRCRWAVERSAREEPPLMPVGASHSSACWVADQLGNSHVPATAAGTPRSNAGA